MPVVDLARQLRRALLAPEVKTRSAVLLGVVAAAFAFARVAWEILLPLNFDLSKDHIYVRDAVTLVPAAIFGLAAIVRAPAWSASVPPSRRLVLLAAGLAVLVCAVIAKVGFLGIPHIADEAAYLWQSQLLAEGRLWGKPFHSTETLIRYVADFEGERISAFFIGSAVPLAVGYVMGVPWLVNPLLAGLLVVITYWAGRRLFDTSAGVLGAILFACSPFLLFQGASYFSHVWTAILTVSAFTLAAAPSRRWHPAAVGALAGAALLSRPLSAVVLAVVIGGFWLWTAGVRRASRSLLWACVGSLPFVGLSLLINRELTGEWLKTAHQLLLPNESIASGSMMIVNAVLNSVGLAFDLVGLTAVGLLLAVFALRSRGPIVLAIGAYAVLQLGAYSLYRYHGISYGPRFLFEVAPLLVVLCAVQIRSTPRLASRSAMIVGLAAAITLAAIVPTRIMLFHQRAEYLRLPTVPAGSLVVMSKGPFKQPDAFHPAFTANGSDPEKADVLFVRGGTRTLCAWMETEPTRVVYSWDVGSRTLLAFDEGSCVTPP